MLQRMDDLLARARILHLKRRWQLRSYVKFIERVATRVSEGGHNIPSDVIRRRYANGIRNLVTLYTPICNFWTIYDNSSADAEIKIIASGAKNTTIKIEDTLSYKTISDYERD